MVYIVIYLGHKVQNQRGSGLVSLLLLLGEELLRCSFLMDLHFGIFKYLLDIFVRDFCGFYCFYRVLIMKGPRSEIFVKNSESQCPNNPGISRSASAQLTPKSTVFLFINLVPERKFRLFLKTIRQFGVVYWLDIKGVFRYQ